MFTPKFVLHWGLPAHPAKFSPGEALSARSTWPNYIQSEGKDSPLWSTWDRQPSSSWLIWHLMQLSVRHFSRTDVFESQTRSTVHESNCGLWVFVWGQSQSDHVLGTSGEWCVRCEVSFGPFFLKKKSSLVKWRWAAWTCSTDQRGRMFIVKQGAGSNYCNDTLNYWLAGLSFFVW